ncbi:Cof-type HAD-IIB family hydrolase [Singulisphaera acidiphila]|uniref:HAD-superfamily hydrolase, subfamily IIB n=1 Tax=Singulisphaera acidiphila (strain ATCC BAA-1392 / DSM 18658 / VKM B-2454 / MOB10) TaxID=886293 RepID=L0DJ16_SINAD|nr:Cof-type HAD-IIB family hydrolase [Singulisphaera acidiphila]AGA29359.1 HAD-superfamily hydrolase, subfamily IIB [Singulisphaera acidiphila DSM 18658]
MRNSKFPYSLAAIDIDDTLVGPDKKISWENRRAVEQLQALGCRVVLASGRRHANMLSFCGELGLDDFVVSAQGARVEHLRTGEVIYHATLTSADQVSLVAEGHRRGFTVMLWLREEVFAEAQTFWVENYSKHSGDDLITIADLLPLTARPAEKIIWAAEPDRIASTSTEMGARYAGQLSVTITEDWYLEFTAPNANKDDGVAALARHLEIPRSAVLAFGDGHNDVSLLSWAGMGVAMPHGRDAARLAARIVASEGNPESALARAVDQLVGEYQSGWVA